MEFANHLRDNFLPECYVEVSTNGNGASHLPCSWTRPAGKTSRYNDVLRDLDLLAQRLCSPGPGIERNDRRDQG